MGQYWKTVSLTKREYVDNYRLACGAKLWEQLANHPGTGAALVILCAAMPESIAPFALVTPDGKWCERGKMGWWGCVSDEKEESTWEDEVQSLLQSYQDCFAVVCDLHI